MIWLVSFAFAAVCALSETDDDFQAVEIHTSSATEYLLLDSEYLKQQSYRFEDFFWTGSGDGPFDETDNPWTTKNPSTVYKTKTVLSTVYVETPSTTINSSADTTPKCSLNCESPSTVPEEITPTPTLNPESTTEEEDDPAADTQFWLLTVLKSDGKDPVIIDLENSLAKLYKTAFQRQQERHLGISNREKRQAPSAKAAKSPVKVHIYDVGKTKLNGNEKIKVLYHVSVSGKPVAATTAADDMSLISDDEVRDALGYPFLIKAEPYMKSSEPQSLAKSKNTWIFIGVSITGLLVILLMVAFLTLIMTKRKKATATTGMDNRRHIFERDAKADREPSPTYINYRNQPSNQTIRSEIPVNRPRSSISYSSSSSTSLDISPLMGLKKHRTPPKKPPRPKAALSMKRIAPELYDSESGGSRRDTPDTIFVGNYDPGVVSPKSYLSMPSVKAFPRGAMPEPLNKVLEPVSVLHLDMPDEELERPDSKPSLIRHGSVGAVEDPGVIGPLVWNMHRQRLQHGVSVDEGINDLKVASSVTRMRKRFHELLDETFSLFGSRRESPVEDSKPGPIEVKSHSAVNNRPNEEIQPTMRPRPKTTDLRRNLQSPSRPKGAWASAAPSPLIRPLSADLFPNPKVNIEHVLAEGKFQPNDPAVPLIAAIKSEIEKCSLPGSAADLRQ